jgi:hypothetical protein
MAFKLQLQFGFLICCTILTSFSLKVILYTDFEVVFLHDIGSYLTHCCPYSCFLIVVCEHCVRDSTELAAH